MSGRGDNNKNGTSGQGASNQSGQALGTDHEKVAHGEQTGGQPSQPQEKQREQDSHRDGSTEGDRR